jgi:hypothetical protein
MELVICRPRLKLMWLVTDFPPLQQYRFSPGLNHVETVVDSGTGAGFLQVLWFPVPHNHPLIALVITICHPELVQ